LTFFSQKTGKFCTLFNSPQHRIAQQCLPDSLIVVALINGEPTKQ
jgi:hypothetical protein